MSTTISDPLILGSRARAGLLSAARFCIAARAMYQAHMRRFALLEASPDPDDRLRADEAFHEATGVARDERIAADAAMMAFLDTLTVDGPVAAPGDPCVCPAPGR